MPKGSKNNQKSQSASPKGKPTKKTKNVSTKDTAPVAVSKTQQVKGPQVTQTRENSSRFKRRELLGTVTSSLETTFALLTSYQLNPGIQATFPWLSSQARGWEQYKFHQLRFEYLPRCPTTTSGSIILSIDYDAADAPPDTEIQACSYANSVEDAVWKGFDCILRPSFMEGGMKRHLVRTGPLSPNLDIKTYDVGKMHLCTSGVPASTGLGKLWVSYDIEFFIPQMIPDPEGDPIGGYIQSGGTISVANPYGTAPNSNPLCTGCHINGSSQLTLDEVGTYVLSQTVSGTGLTSGVNPGLISGIANFVTSSGAVNGLNTYMSQRVGINVTQAPAVFNLANMVTGSTTVTASGLDIGRAPGGALG